MLSSRLGNSGVYFLHGIRRSHTLDGDVVNAPSLLPPLLPGSFGLSCGPWTQRLTRGFSISSFFSSFFFSGTGTRGRSTVDCRRLRFHHAVAARPSDPAPREAKHVARCNLTIIPPPLPYLLAGIPADRLPRREGGRGMRRSRSLLAISVGPEGD